MRRLSILLSGLLLILVQLTAGHPGDHPEPQPYSESQLRAKRTLSNCLKTRPVREAAERREAWTNIIRQKRDTATALATNHHSSAQGLTSSSNPFTGNATCLLQPEVTVGPYWVNGEFIRQDVRENQAGVELFLDIQVIDIHTCQPVTNVYADVWHCNATGVYAGVLANGNGNSNDLTNLNATFLRGLQPTDSNGVARFITIFPGHYMGRTNHIHALIHRNGTVLPNNTYTSGTIPHIGQIFFDQSLVTSVEATAPYNTNAVTPTTNVQDSIAAQESASASDPYLNYVLLGSSVSNGLLGWITVGVDLTSDQTSQASAQSTLTANGGVANGNGMGGGGPGCGGGMGGPPAGQQGGYGGAGQGGQGGFGVPPGGMGGPAMQPGAMGPGGFNPATCAQNGTASTLAPVPGGSSAGAGGGPTPLPAAGTTPASASGATSASASLASQAPSSSATQASGPSATTSASSSYYGK